MYNRLVVALNRYNFAGLLHSLDVFLGKEGATQLPARDLHRLTPPVAARAENLCIRRSNRFRGNSCLAYRYYSIPIVGYATRAKKDAERKKRSLIDVGGRLR